MKISKEIWFSVAIIVVVIIIRTFIITPAFVNGHSMYPTLHHHDVLLVEKFNKKIERFDIVVINHEGTMLVKRVIGLPGEYIEYKDSKLYVNNIEIEEPFTNSTTNSFKMDEMLDFDKIPRDFYFVVGDNRENSQDSRVIGFIPASEIVGKAVFRLFPSPGKIDR